MKGLFVCKVQAHVPRAAGESVPCPRAAGREEGPPSPPPVRRWWWAPCGGRLAVVPRRPPPPAAHAPAEPASPPPPGPPTPPPRRPRPAEGPPTAQRLQSSAPTPMEISARLSTVPSGTVSTTSPFGLPSPIYSPVCSRSPACHRSGCGSAGRCAVSVLATAGQTQIPAVPLLHADITNAHIDV